MHILLKSPKAILKHPPPTATILVVYDRKQYAFNWTLHRGPFQIFVNQRYRKKIGVNDICCLQHTLYSTIGWPCLCYVDPKIVQNRRACFELNKMCVPRSAMNAVLKVGFQLCTSCMYPASVRLAAFCKRFCSCLIIHYQPKLTVFLTGIGGTTGYSSHRVYSSKPPVGVEFCSKLE